MLKPTVIFKGRTARSIKSVTKRSDVVIGHQKKGWMDHAQMLIYMDQGGASKAHQDAALSLGVRLLQSSLVG